MDRRLLARARFQNTTTAFDGLTVQIGRDEDALTARVIALFPVTRLAGAFDRADEEQRLLGVIGEASTDSAVLEPYYLNYRSDAVIGRTLHTTGVHGFGSVGSSKLDYDLHVALQFGNNSNEPHRAFAVHAEMGRSLQQSSVQRVAGWLNYASGDRDPEDGRSNRFDSLFGASHAMYGFTGLFTWQNVVNPAVSVSVRPSRRTRLDAFYRLYWLASSRHGLVRIGLSDPTGASGTFVGQEVDVSLRWLLFRSTELEIQYGELVAGSFLDRIGGGRGATVLFLAVVVGTGRP